MARADGQPDSATTSFSIILGDAPHLDGQYTVFGEVVYGMDAVDKLVQVPPLFIDAHATFAHHSPGSDQGGSRSRQKPRPDETDARSGRIDSARRNRQCPQERLDRPPSGLGATTDVASNSFTFGSTYLQSGGLVLIARDRPWHRSLCPSSYPSSERADSICVGSSR